MVAVGAVGGAQKLEMESLSKRSAKECLSQTHGAKNHAIKRFSDS
jgi:hypothetical protein